MGTTFTDSDGREVARCYWGGRKNGTVVELRPAAADISMTTPIRGDDGSTTTLEALAQGAGRGADPFGVPRPWCPACGDMLDQTRECLRCTDPAWRAEAEAEARFEGAQVPGRPADR